jgi:hypothetical protein
LALKKPRKKVALSWWLRTYALALRRKPASWLRRETDPYPPPPKGVCLSPSLHHFHAYDRAPLRLSWRRMKGRDAAEWQTVTRHRLVQLLGLETRQHPPEAHHPEEFPLREGLRRRRVYLRVDEAWDVPVHLVWLEPEMPRMPVLLYLAGSTSGVHVAWGGVRIPADYLLLGVGADMARQAAMRGYLVACIEQACFGERLERALRPRSAARCIDAANHALLLGRCLLGEQVADVISVVDWLEAGGSGLDADLDRLHLFGHSSGGTVAVYAAAVETRIRAAICSGSVGPIRETIARRRNPEGAATVPGILNWMETEDVVGLCAPRPFIGVSGVRDHIFPFQGVQDVVEGARDVYRDMGRVDRIHAVAGPAGHQYYPKETWEAVGRLLGT